MRVIGEYVNSEPYCIECLESDSEQKNPPITTQTETDTPIHCRDCEKLLHVKLTDYGYDYIANRIIEFTETDGEIGRGEILKEWHRYYGHSVDLDQNYIEKLEDLTLTVDDSKCAPSS